MIKKSKMLAVTLSVCVLPMASCSIFQKMSKTEETIQPEIKQEAVLPQDREAVHIKRNNSSYSPKEFKEGVVSGDWAIEEVLGKKAVGEEAPFLKFAPVEGKVYGNNGCNTINAEYTYNPQDSTLSFSYVVVTMRLCGTPGLTDFLVNQAINETAKYTLEEGEDCYYLNFFSESDLPLMRLKHQNFDFLNGTWKVVNIGDEAINIDKMKLVFDVDEHKMHGNTGCNVINGVLNTDMDAPNSISFEAIGVTMMLCPEMKYQSALLVALEEACRAKAVSKNRVVLLNSNDNEVLTLERTSDK